MARSVTVLVLLVGLSGALAASCGDLLPVPCPLEGGCDTDTTTCSQELACANQDAGLINTCCAHLGVERWRCWYEVPDGEVFECEEIADEMSAANFCEQAVDDMTAYCTDE